METFNQAKNLARVATGFGDGPMFKNLNVAPSMTFKDAIEPTVKAKLDAAATPQPTPIDPWVARYPNAKVK